MIPAYIYLSIRDLIKEKGLQIYRSIILEAILWKSLHDKSRRGSTRSWADMYGTPARLKKQSMLVQQRTARRWAQFFQRLKDC